MADTSSELDQQRKTFREFFTTYNKMSEVCFNHCIHDFGVDSIRNRENRCVNKCVNHYLSASKEIQRVFAEDQANLITTGTVHQN